VHASVTRLQWVVDAYNLAFAGTLLTAGALGDRLGGRAMLAFGFTFFGAAELISAASLSAWASPSSRASPASAPR